MPSKSPEQHRAMAAAAAGHSTLGIPKSVGKEFMAADRKNALVKALKRDTGYIQGPSGTRG